MDAINIPQAELGEKNIFEEIFELLERHRLNVEQNFPLENLYDVVNDFDIQFQKFNSSDVDEGNLKIFNNLLNYTVANFLTIFKSKGFTNEPIFYAFKRFIAFFSIVLREANRHKSQRDIARNFFENFPSLAIDIRKYFEDAQALYYYHYHGKDLTPEQEAVFRFEDEFPTEIGVHHETDDEKVLTIYCNEFTGKFIVWNEETAKYDVIDEQYYMILDITVDTDAKSVEKLLTPFWLLTSALEKIENVTIEIDDIHKGSLKVSLKVWMKDLLAKEETKAVLETAKEATIKTLTAGQVSFAEVKKSRQETRKLELENTKLEKEIEQLPSGQEVKFERALELERKMLENEKMQIENTKAKIEVIQQLSDLVSKGIIQADMIRVDINQVLYLLKEKDEIKEIGPDISEIS